MRADGLTQPSGNLPSAYRRDQAIAISKSRPAEALKIAESITDAWFRAQAMATVARYAPDDIARGAFEKAATAAAQGKDSYQRSAVLAWPIRAAIKTGNESDAADLLARSRRELPRIEFHCSRAEAIGLIFQASFPGSRRLWQPLLEELESVCLPDTHWRAARLYRDMAAILRRWNDDAARLFVETMPAGKAQERCRRDHQAGRQMPPRPFFW